MVTAGLYELSQYAFLADRNGGEGLTWAKLHDPDCGMITVWAILAAEWFLFMTNAWYLDQVCKILLLSSMRMHHNSKYRSRHELEQANTAVVYSLRPCAMVGAVLCRAARYHSVSESLLLLRLRLCS